MKSKAAILGAGPTGLIAARALADSGWDVSVYSQDLPPKIPTGAFYYHRLPGSIAEKIAPSVIGYCSLGDKDTYERKQWGALYDSSFPEGDQDDYTHYEVRLGWWPSDRIQAHLLNGIRTFGGAITPHSTYINGRLASTHDLVVLTFPLRDFLPFRRYPTPVVRVALREILEVFRLTVEPSQFCYSGILRENHSSLVRVVTPPKDFELGFGYVELTRYSHLATAYWPDRTTYIQEVHPFQRPIVPEGLLADNVIVAGRVATGNAKYLADNVLDALKPYLGEER